MNADVWSLISDQAHELDHTSMPEWKVKFSRNDDKNLQYRIFIGNVQHYVV